MAVTAHDVVIGNLSRRQMLKPGPQRLVLLEGGDYYLEPLWVLWMVAGFVFEISWIVDQGRRHGDDYR